MFITIYRAFADRRKCEIADLGAPKSKDPIMMSEINVKQSNHLLPRYRQINRQC